MTLKSQHYKLTDDRRYKITKVVTAALTKRPKLAEQGLEVPLEDLQLLAFSDEQLEALRTANSFYPMSKFSTVYFIVETGHAKYPWGGFAMHTGGNLFWPRQDYPLPPVYPENQYMGQAQSARYPNWRQAGVILQPVDVITCERRRAVTHTIMDWATIMHRSAARCELGLSIMNKMLRHSTLVANVQATIPDVRVLLDDAGYTDVTRAMDRAPGRTLSNYRLSEEKLSTAEMQAFRTLLAESLLLPDPPAGRTVHRESAYATHYRFFEVTP